MKVTCETFSIRKVPLLPNNSTVGSAVGPKVATHDSQLGTVSGIQFPATLQSVLIGLLLQVALPAKAIVAELRDKTTARQRENFTVRSEQKKTAKSSRFGKVTYRTMGLIFQVALSARQLTMVSDISGSRHRLGE